MDILKVIAIIVLALLGLANIIISFIKPNRKNEQEIKEKEDLVIEGAYEKKYLFTKKEYAAYFKLKEIADNKGYILFSKIRLLDLLEPRRNHPKYRTLFWKVQSKHVDFVLCDNKLIPKYIIELDDETHKRRDRKERDKFVDSILKDVGYTVIRTNFIDESFSSMIK